MVAAHGNHLCKSLVGCNHPINQTTALLAPHYILLLPTHIHTSTLQPVYIIGMEYVLLDTAANCTLKYKRDHHQTHTHVYNTNIASWVTQYDNNFMECPAPCLHFIYEAINAVELKNIALHSSCEYKQ